MTVLTSQAEQTDGIAAAIIIGIVAVLAGLHGFIDPTESSGIAAVNFTAGLLFIAAGVVQIV